MKLKAGVFYSYYFILFENVIWIFHNNVSANNMSTVVMSVLQILRKFKVDEAELPKQTFSKLIFQKANPVSSRPVAEEFQLILLFTEMEHHATARRLLISKQRRAMASTEQHVLWMSKVVMPNLGLSSLSWTSWPVWFLPILVSSAKTLFSKIKNTVGDKGASQKSFVHKLEQYRSEILPDVISN